jgi:hypothetical protein
MGSDGDVPVALTWGHHVGLLVDHRYVPVVLTTAEPGNWVRDLNRHLEEVFLRLPGGACIFDVNGNITCWIRKDALYSAVQALRILFGPCVHGKDVVRLHGLLGTEFVRVADVQSDGNLVLQAMSVHGPDSDPTWTHRPEWVNAGEIITLPPKEGTTEPRQRVRWSDGTFCAMVPVGARIALLSD